MKRISSFPVAFALTVSVLSLGACGDPLNDPIPERIQKGPIVVELQPVAAGLVSPVLAIAAPKDASGRLFIVDQVGMIRIVRDGKLLPEPFLDVRERLVKLEAEFDERGLLGLALDPGFSDSQSPGYGRLFTYSSEPVSGKADLPDPYLKEIPPNHHAVIAAWKVDASNPDRVDPSSRSEILRIDEPQPNHNAGMIAFGPDGFLYIALGDGGAANDMGPGHNPQTGNAQDVNTPLGKILRIDVNGKDSANGKYGIPSDNPFAAGGGLKEIFAIGLRNPYRFSFDGAALLVGDVGQNKIEMVHRVEKGGNYGWRLKEGSFHFNPDGSIDTNMAGLPPGLKDPVFQYDHEEGISVMGGFVYHGKLLPKLRGKYVFGDWRSAASTNSGRLFYGDLDTHEIRELQIGPDSRPVGFLIKGFGQDAAGELYVCGSATGGPSGTTGVVMKLIGPAIP